MKKVIIVAMLISILLLGLTGIVFAQENIIKIGVSVSLTGRLAQPGRLLRDGFVIWEDWVNSHGGITAGGINYKVKMVYYDDESTPVRGAKLTEMLITQNKVDFLFGPLSSAITFATSAIGEKYKIITIAPNANATNIYERGYKYVFSLLPPATYALQPIAYMTENLDPKPKTVAMITVNDLFPLSCAEGFRDKAKELGLEIVLDEKYPAGATDISTLLTQVKALNPDILVSSGYPVDTIMILKECKELNINPKMYAFAQNFDYITLGQVGADAEYILEHVWWVPGMKNTDKFFGTTADYVQVCKDKFGPDYITAFQVASGSAAGVLLHLAIEKADSIETEKVREALLSLDVEMSCWPAVAFNEKGQNIKWQHPIQQVQDGKQVVVYPEFYQEAAIRYPAPEWKNR